ncbi:DUF4252 domain-containing protein [Agarilytica rhodophyticola]|uniref:DUF4252 domain-containing protein n=1 Tax=Agarilytica rhodophyticola TaxID=1737490 RepID=UPI000B341AA6|nr:DUF4252 domain-containing protein [Agarilytica rhodophyticola]
MMNALIKILPLLILLSLSGCGITTAGLISNPGYARLSYPSVWEADKQLSISLGPWAIRTLVNFTDDGDLNQQQLKKILGLRVTIYNVHKNAPTINQHIQESVNQLKQDGWVQTVSINEGVEKNVVMVKFGEDLIEGFSVMSIDQEEAVFVNIIGDLDPKFFDQLINQVNANQHNDTLKVSYL